MKYCGRCGQEADDEAIFCKACGYTFTKPLNDTTADQHYDSSQTNLSGSHPNHIISESQSGHPHALPSETAASNNEPLAPSETRKSGKKIKILICSALALLLVAAGGFWGWQKYGTEARTQAKLDLGIKYLSENDYEKAILAFDEAIKIDPNEVKGYQGLAKTYTLQGKYDDAKAAYERGVTAVKLEYQLVLRLSLAGMYIDKGDLSQAESFFQEIINGNKSCVDAYIGLALVYQQQGDIDKAREVLEKAIRENSQNYRSYNALAKFYADSSETDQALTNVIKSLDLEVNQQQAYMILDGLYSGEWAGLVSKADDVAGSKSAAMLKFYAEYSDQNYSDALPLYRSNLESDSKNMKAKILAAICMVKNGQKDEAAGIITKVTKGKLTASTMVELARYYQLTGDEQNAKLWTGKAIRQDGLNPDIILTLVEVNKENDNKAYAIQYLVFDWQPVVITKEELEGKGLSFLLDSITRSSSVVNSEANALFPVKVGGKWGFIDKTGKVIVQPEYDMALISTDGMALVQIGDKWGYLNDKGLMVIQPQEFEPLGVFSEGLVSVRLDKKQYGYMNKSGKIVFRTKYPGYDFHNGMAVVSDGFKYGFVDRNGKMLTDLIYKKVGSNPPLFNTNMIRPDRGFSEGLLAVRVDDKWGFMDKKGKMVIVPKYHEACNFSDGLALVNTDDKSMEGCGWIDNTGNMIVQWPVGYDWYNPYFSEGFVVMKKGDKYGFMDKNGNMLTDLIYDNASDFHEGLALVKSGEKWGFIDNRGQMAIVLPDGCEPFYLSRFYNGLFQIADHLDKELRYIDKTGCVVWSENNKIESLTRLAEPQDFQGKIQAAFDLGSITTSIADGSGSRCLNTDISIGYDSSKINPEECEKNKAMMRDIILSILSSKTVRDFDSGNRDMIRREIQRALNDRLGSNVVVQVYFGVLIIK